MRRISYKPYAALLAALWMALSLPQRVTDPVRSTLVAAVSPSWRGLHFLKMSLFDLAALFPSAGVLTLAGTDRELEILRQENHYLRTQVETLKHALATESLIHREVAAMQGKPIDDDFSRRRYEELFRLVDLQMHSLGAKVIYREPASWSSSFWIDIGERNNRIVGKRIIAKNSPVVLGTHVVGVVEYISERRSRVRLITDSNLVPSVRAVRGEEPASYLAKGEVRGSSQPLWRSRGITLKGTGFNYDFPDAEGPARHLLTGEPIDQLGHGKKIALLQPGDLLVTTGMDGVFPAGLKVATVISVQPLREGGCSFDLEARSVVADLDDLSFVTVLPPLEA